MDAKESEKIFLILFEYKTAGLSLTFLLYLSNLLKNLSQCFLKASK